MLSAVKNCPLVLALLATHTPLLSVTSRRTSPSYQITGLNETHLDTQPSQSQLVSNLNPLHSQVHLLHVLGPQQGVHSWGWGSEDTLGLETDAACLCQSDARGLDLSGRNGLCHWVVSDNDVPGSKNLRTSFLRAGASAVGHARLLLPLPATLGQLGPGLLGAGWVLWLWWAALSVSLAGFCGCGGVHGLSCCWVLWLWWAALSISCWCPWSLESRADFVMWGLLLVLICHANVCPSSSPTLMWMTNPAPHTSPRWASRLSQARAAQPQVTWLSASRARACRACWEACQQFLQGWLEFPGFLLLSWLCGPISGLQPERPLTSVSTLPPCGLTHPSSRPRSSPC